MRFIKLFKIKMIFRALFKKLIKGWVIIYSINLSQRWNIS